MTDFLKSFNYDTGYDDVVATYESCTAECVMGEYGEENGKWFSILLIMSKQEGKGHAQKLIQETIEYAKEYNCTKIIVPTILSAKLDHIMHKLGFKPGELGKRGDETVVGYYKDLNIKS